MTTNNITFDGLSGFSSILTPKHLDATNLDNSPIEWTNDQLLSFMDQFAFWEDYFEELLCASDTYIPDLKDLCATPDFLDFYKEYLYAWKSDYLRKSGYVHLSTVAHLFQTDEDCIVLISPRKFKNYKNSLKLAKNIQKNISTVCVSSASSTFLLRSRDQKSPRKEKLHRSYKRDEKYFKRSGAEFQMDFLNPFRPAMSAYNNMTNVVNDLQGITNVFKDFATPELADQVRSTLDNFYKLSYGVNNHVTPEALDKLAHTPGKISDAFSGIAKVLESTKESLSATTMWISIGAGLHYLHSRDKTSMYICGIAGLFAFTLSGGHHTILQWLMRTYGPSETVQQIGLESVSSTASIGIAALAGLVGFSDSRVNIPKLVWNYFKERDRMTTSLTDTLKDILLFFEWAFNKVAGHFGNIRYIKFLSASLPMVDDYIDKTDAFKHDVENDKVLFTQTSYDRLLDLCKEGEAILKELPVGPPTANIAQLLRLRLAWLDRKRSDFEKSSFNGDGSRPEPVCILLKGPPGTGKTQLLSFLHNAITSATLPPELVSEFDKFPEKFLYARQMEAEYWDQYDAFKWVCLFDDLGQIRDQVGMADGEWMNVIRAVNSGPYALHMAGIADKGKTFFKSRFVICTTNMDQLESESINSMEAVNRRMHIVVDVKFNPKFTKIGDDGKECLDPDKLPGGVYTEDVPLLLLNTEPLRTISSTKDSSSKLVHNAPTEPITFRDLVDLILCKYEAKKQQYEQAVIERARIRGEFRQYNLSWCSPEDMEYDVSHLAQIDLSGANSEMIEFLHMFEKKYAYADNLTMYERLHSVVHEMKLSSFEDTSFNPVLHALYSFQKKFGDKACEMFFDTSRAQWEDVKEAFLFSEKQMARLTVGKTCRFGLFSDIRKKLISFHEEHLATPAGKVFKWVNSSYVLLGGIGLLAAGVSYFLARHSSSLPVSDTEIGLGPQSFGHSDRMRVPSQTLKDMRAKMLSSNQSKGAVAQMASSFPSFAPSDKIMKSNVYEFITQQLTGMKSSGFGIFVTKRMFMVPAHFVTKLATNCAETPGLLDLKVELKNHYSGRVIKMTYRDFVFAPCVMKDESDVALLDLPKQLTTECACMLKHFIQQKQVEAMTHVPIMITRPDLKSEIHTTQAVFQKQHLVSGVPMQQVYCYRGPFTQGDCGRPLFVLHNNSSWGSFGGLHIAGCEQEHYGLSAIVTREAIDVLIAELLTQQAPDLGATEQMKLEELPDRFSLVRVVSDPVLTSGSTKIRKSRLHGAWGPANTRASRLRPFVNKDGEMVDPFQKALAKYCINPIELPMELLIKVAFSYGDWLETVSMDIPARVYTFEEGVLGLEGHRYFSAVKRNTSPGYPFIHLPLYKGKASYPIFGDNMEYDLTTSACLDLKERVLKIIENCLKGIRSEIIYTDNLKDERVKLEKWLSGLTRLFSGSPKDYIIAFRMFFGAFCEWYAINNIANHSAIGVNPYSLDWDRLARKFRAIGGDDLAFGAGDYKGFDGSEKSQVHDLQLAIVNRWYTRRGATPEENQVRTMLWKELTNSKHIRHNIIYEWLSSLPSGHPMTAIVNSMYNEINFRYCWARMGQQLEIDYHESIKDFESDCALIVLGDDNAYAVSPKYREYFTEVAVADWMSEIGMVYTSELKDVGLHKSLRRLEDIEFLKRSFRYDNVLRRWVAPLRLSVILEIPYWTKAIPGQMEAIVGDNVQEALNELALHPRSTYEEWAPQIIQAYRNHYNCSPRRQTYEMNQDFVLNLDCFWF